jgi:hypothetical protein
MTQQLRNISWWIPIKWLKSLYPNVHIVSCTEASFLSRAMIHKKILLSVAEFIDHDWGKVNSGIGSSNRSPRLAGRYDNPMPESTLSPPVRDLWIRLLVMYTVQFLPTVTPNLGQVLPCCHKLLCAVNCVDWSATLLLTQASGLEEK